MLSQTAFPENILTSPYFETSNTSGWWRCGCTINASTLIQNGGYSVFVNNRTATRNGIAQSLEKVGEGQTCSISWWTRVEKAVSAQIKISIKQNDDTGTQYYPLVAVMISDSGCTNWSGFFTFQVTGIQSELLVYFKLPFAGRNFFVDDACTVITSSGDWETEANQKIEQNCKGDFRIYNGTPNNPNLPISDFAIQINKFGSISHLDRS